MVRRKTSTEFDWRANNKLCFLSNLKGSPALASACFPKLFLNQSWLGTGICLLFPPSLKWSNSKTFEKSNELNMVVFTGLFPLVQLPVWWNKLFLWALTLRQPLGKVSKRIVLLWVEFGGLQLHKALVLTADWAFVLALKGTALKTDFGSWAVLDVLWGWWCKRWWLSRKK